LTPEGSSAAGYVQPEVEQSQQVFPESSSRRGKRVVAEELFLADREECRAAQDHQSFSRSGSQERRF